MIGSFIALIFPLGFGTAALLGALAAHRGFPTRGTWTLLISSIVYLVILFIMFGSMAFSSMSMGSGGGDFKLVEVLLMLLGILWFLSLVAMSVGAFLMTSQWRDLSSEAEELEQLALQLASKREEIESSTNTTQ